VGGVWMIYFLAVDLGDIRADLLI